MHPRLKVCVGDFISSVPARGIAKGVNGAVTNMRGIKGAKLSSSWHMLPRLQGTEGGMRPVACGAVRHLA